METFFVLSGFLITSLLLIEWQSTGSINLRNFWLLLLILPILAVFIAHDALPRLKEDIPAA